MKFLKILLATLGVIALGVAAYFLLGRVLWNMREIMGAANANRSVGFPDPMNNVYMTSGLAALGGLLLGIGIGLPGRTAGGIRKAALEDAAARREAEIRSRATAHPVETTEVVVDEHKA